MSASEVEDKSKYETNGIRDNSKPNSRNILDNQLESLNGESSSQKWILEVDWKQKNLTSVPEFRQEYQFCTNLNLSGNNLEGEIDWLIHLRRLESLDLSQNKYTHITACGSVSTLKYLNLSHNLLKLLPEWILLLENVKYLNISYNPLQKAFHVHLKKAKWKSIEICHLENVNLVSIPDCLLSAKNLKELYIGNVNESCKNSIYESNNIWKMPVLPSSISKLDVSHVNLLGNFIDYNWELLPNLREFHAKGNELSWPSPNFTLLTKLETCDFSSCKIFLLPKDIGCLNNLCFLNLSFNKFSVLPKSVEQLHNLKHLDCYLSGIEIIECNLAQLTSLVKCDLWMNPIDPEEFLPNHSQLCDNLRSHLPLVEKENRLNERVCPSVASAAGFISENEYDSDNEKEYESDDLGEESDNPRELTALSTGTGVEESWDDDVYSDEDCETKSSSHVGSQSKINDHYFLPSLLHASACSLPPDEFQIIQGQFDDVD